MNVISGVDFGQFKSGNRRFQSCVIAGVWGRGVRMDQRAQPCVRGALVNLVSNLLGTSTRSLLGLPYFTEIHEKGVAKLFPSLSLRVKNPNEMLSGISFS